MNRPDEIHDLEPDEARPDNDLLWTVVDWCLLGVLAALLFIAANGGLK